MKLLAYVEFDEAEPNGGTIGFEIVGKHPGNEALVSPEKSTKAELITAIFNELKASGANGYRRISIVTEDGMVTVERGPSPGPIAGYGLRMHAEVDRVFPRHA